MRLHRRKPGYSTRNSLSRGLTRNSANGDRFSIFIFTMCDSSRITSDCNRVHGLANTCSEHNVNINLFQPRPSAT
jgi:hypothetical protein